MLIKYNMFRRSTYLDYIFLKLLILFTLYTLSLSSSANGASLPASGEWEGSAGFGKIEFSVTSGGTGISEIALIWSNFSCGVVTYTSGSQKISFITPMPISNYQASIYIDLTPPFSTESRSITIDGSFDNTGSSASGTYEADIEGTICAGAWNASSISGPIDDGQSTYDATGDWKITISDCQGTCGLKDELEGTDIIPIDQNGNNVTLVIHEDEGDETWTGNVNGKNYDFSYSWVEDDGWTGTGNLSFTLSSSTSGTGILSMSWTDGNESCDEECEIVLIKQAGQTQKDNGGSGGGGGCFILNGFK